MVGDLGHEHLRGHAGHGRRAAADQLGALVELAPLAVVIFLQIQLQRGQHAEHLFLVDLHPAADRVAVWRGVEPGRRDEVLPAEQQAGALRSADPLAAGERHQIEAHAGVLPQVLDRRHVGGRVVQRRNGVLLSKLGELRVLNPPFLVVVVVEEHHRGLVAHRPLEILARLDLHQPDAAVADGVLVPETVGLLHDNVALHAGEIRQIANLLSVAAGEHGGRAQRERRRGPGGDHGGFGAHQLRDALAHAIVQLVEHHEVLGGVVDRLHHFRRHQGSRHGRVRPCPVDEGAHAHLAEVVPSFRAAAAAGAAPAPMKPPTSGTAETVSRKRLRLHMLRLLPSGPHRVFFYLLLAGPHPRSLRLDSLRSLAAAAGALRYVARG